MSELTEVVRRARWLRLVASSLLFVTTLRKITMRALVGVTGGDGDVG